MKTISLVPLMAEHKFHLHLPRDSKVLGVFVESQATRLIGVSQDIPFLMVEIDQATRGALMDKKCPKHEVCSTMISEHQDPVEFELVPGFGQRVPEDGVYLYTFTLNNKASVFHLYKIHDPVS